MGFHCRRFSEGFQGPDRQLRLFAAEPPHRPVHARQRRHRPICNEVSPKISAYIWASAPASCRVLRATTLCQSGFFISAASQIFSCECAPVVKCLVLTHSLKAWAMNLLMLIGRLGSNYQITRQGAFLLPPQQPHV